MPVEIIVNGNKVPLQQGDVLDVGPDGVILWLTDEQSVAYRIIAKERAQEVKRSIAFSKKKLAEAVFPRFIELKNYRDQREGPDNDFDEIEKALREALKND